MWTDGQTDRVILIYPQTMLSGLIDKNNKQINIFFIYGLQIHLLSSYYMYSEMSLFRLLYEL